MLYNAVLKYRNIVRIERKSVSRSILLIKTEIVQRRTNKKDQFISHSNHLQRVKTRTPVKPETILPKKSMTSQVGILQGNIFKINGNQVHFKDLRFYNHMLSYDDFITTVGRSLRRKILRRHSYHVAEV